MSVDSYYIVCPRGPGMAVEIKEWDKSKKCPWCGKSYESHLQGKNK